MRLVQRNDMVQDLSSATPNPPLRQSILPGARTHVRFAFNPAARKNAITSPSNFRSRSRITYR